MTPVAMQGPGRTPGESRGDQELVYARYLGPIYRFAYARVGNREDAEDLTAETFLKASRHLDTARSEASIAAWLFTVVGTVLADHWRTYYRHGALLPLDESHPDPAVQTVSEAGEQSEPERQVAAILEALPEQYRRVLDLRFLRGFSVLETAQELGVTPANAKVLQHRALARAARLGSAPSASTSPSAAFLSLGQPLPARKPERLPPPPPRYQG